MWVNACNVVMLEMYLFQMTAIVQVSKTYLGYLVIRQLKNLQGLHAAQPWRRNVYS